MRRDDHSKIRSAPLGAEARSPLPRRPGNVYIGHGSATRDSVEIGVSVSIDVFSFCLLPLMLLFLVFLSASLSFRRYLAVFHVPFFLSPFFLLSLHRGRRALMLPGERAGIPGAGYARRRGSAETSEIETRGMPAATRSRIIEIEVSASSSGLPAAFAGEGAAGREPRLCDVNRVDNKYGGGHFFGSEGAVCISLACFNELLVNGTVRVSSVFVRASERAEV